MNNRLILLLLISLMSVIQIIGAAEIDEKKSQLSNLKKQIQENKKKAGELDKKKKQALQEKKKIDSKISQSDSKIKQLKMNEKKLRDHLSKTRNEINLTVSKMNETKTCGEKQLTRLLFFLKEKESYGRNSKYQYPLAFVVNSTSDSYNQLENQKENLVDKKEITEKKVINVQNESVSEFQKKNQYASLSGKLNKDINSFEKEKTGYIRKNKELERSAIALEGLLKKLQATPEKKKDYTYKFTGGIIKWPVKGQILRHYGVQNHEKYHIQTINNGIDIAVSEGTSVLAAADGEVVFSGNFTGNGKMIIVDHKNGYHTVYAFNQSLLVSQGNQVKQGQSIALSGISPALEKPCVHFEVRKNGKPVNPMNFLK